MILLKNKNRGFIALLSVVIISFVLLSAAITLNLSSFHVRFNILDSEYKEISDALASACIEQARLILVNDNSYLGSVDVSIGAETCHYEILAGGEIISSATVNNAFTFYWAEVDLGDPNIPITNFKECANLSTCP